MTAAVEQRLSHWQRLAVVVAIAGAIFSAVLACLAPHALPLAWRIATFGCLAPALGSLLFALIHRMTGGQWGAVLRPFLQSGLRLLPWVWLAVLPLWWFPHVAPTHGSAPPVWHGYDSRAMLGVRGLGELVVFGVLAVLVSTATRDDTPEQRSRPWLGPAGFIGLVLALHLLADDWLVALQPHWVSTGFPLVWMCGQTLSGLAAAVLGALALGADPSRSGAAGRPWGIDAGNLLLAAMMFWSYVAFVEFLIIWSGDLPHEISWYLARTHGAWAIVPPLLAVVHFVVPMAVLLSRRAKKSPRVLGFAAALLLAAQWLYQAWLVLPSFPETSVVGFALVVVLSAAAAGGWAWFYLAGVRRAEVIVA